MKNSDREKVYLRPIAIIVFISLLSQNTISAEKIYSHLAPPTQTRGRDVLAGFGKDTHDELLLAPYKTIIILLKPLIGRYNLSLEKINNIMLHLAKSGPHDKTSFSDSEDEYDLAEIIFYFVSELKQKEVSPSSLTLSPDGQIHNSPVEWFPNRLKLYFSRFYEDTEEVAIGDASILVSNPISHWNVPVTDFVETDENLKHLQWMLKKDSLDQDMFLIGPPGPERRTLAMRFAELTHREVEYIPLSSDTTEFDLKQRREKISGTTRFFDEAAVRAAINGRLLILDNVQYAERNVLPTLNNLLENREINLEDGRRIISPGKYDKLLETHPEEELNRQGIIRAHPRFRVIALGCLNLGNPLDPPFRSRFQGREIGYPEDMFELLRLYVPEMNEVRLRNLIAFSELTRELNKDPSLMGKIPILSANGLIRIVSIINEFPDIPVQDAIKRVYPFPDTSMEVIARILKEYQLWDRKIFSSRRKFVKKVKPENILVPLVDFVETEDSKRYFQGMAEDYVFGNNMLLVGDKGVGKTMQALHLAQTFGLETEVFSLYKDITSRDLLQRRITKPNGDTGWKNTPLIESAIHGRVVILDGIHQLKPNIISVLHRLMQDREIDLPDGTRLVSPRKYQYLLTFMNGEELKDKKIFPVHPDFRIIALGETPSKENRWLTQEIIELFSLHIIGYPSPDSEKAILRKVCAKGPIGKLQKMARSMRESRLRFRPSLRQLVHIARYIEQFGEDSVWEALEKATLIQFLPGDEISGIKRIVEACGFKIKQKEAESEVVIETDKRILRMDELTCELTEPKNPALVPDPSPFYDVPEHKRHLKRMFEDYLLSPDIDMLLIGMQGTGKNKIADRFIQLLNREREYMQLHRDTTVDELTTRQALHEGRLVWEDSPLVKSALSGHILLLDEADKAPPEVVYILKNLIEYRQMLLPDGRRLIPSKHYQELLKQHGEDKLSERGIFPIHPDFRMIILANRPGLPFLGNDFYRELGDLLSTHVIDNPPEESELAMLKRYAPDVPDITLLKLINAFNALRELFRQNEIPYPYSTRELVAIAKHIQRYPNDPIEDVLRNVLSFDEAVRRKEVMELILQPFLAQGLISETEERSLELSLAERKPMPDKERRSSTLGDAGRLQFQKHRVSTGNFMDLQVEKGSFIPRDERIKKFGEQVLSWKTASEGYVDMGVLPDGKIVTLTQKDGIWLITVWDMEKRTYTSIKLGRVTPGLAIITVLPDNRVLINFNGLSIIDLNTFKIAEVSLGNLDTRNMHIYMSQDRKNPFNVALSFSPSDPYRASEISSFTAGIADFTPGSESFSSFNQEVRVEGLVLLDNNTILYKANKGIYILSKITDDGVWVRRIAYPPRDKTYNYLSFLGNLDAIASYAIFNTSYIMDLLLQDVSTTGDMPVDYMDLPDNVYHGLWLDNGVRVLGTSGGRYGDTSRPPKLIILDPRDKTIRWIQAIPDEGEVAFLREEGFGNILQLPDGRIITMQRHGKIRVWELDENKVKADLEEEKRKREARKKRLELRVRETKGKLVGKRQLYDGAPKEGLAPDGEAHIGGRMFRGGTGGFDTAGLGGIGGPWREKGPKKQGVVRRSDRDSVKLTPEAERKRQRLKAEHLAAELRKLENPGEGADEYFQYMQTVSGEIQDLRTILESLEFKGHEAVWDRRRIDGELDDDRVVDGLTGARDVYRRRREKDKQQVTAEKKKRIYFAIDVSASMYSYNYNDGRLDRAKALAVMIMEAFSGYEDRYDYCIVGHSGSRSVVPLVDFGKPPSQEERFKVIRKMELEASHTEPGDHTLSSARIGMESVVEEEADDYFVFLVSDANFERYGITPEELTSILTSNKKVKGYAIFIAAATEGGARAEAIASALPGGRGKVATDTKGLPRIFRDFFTRDVLSGAQKFIGTEAGPVEINDDDIVKIDKDLLPISIIKEMAPDINLDNIDFYVVNKEKLKNRHVVRKIVDGRLRIIMTKSYAMYLASLDKESEAEALLCSIVHEITEVQGFSHTAAVINEYHITHSLPIRVKYEVEMAIADENYAYLVQLLSPYTKAGMDPEAYRISEELSLYVLEKLIEAGIIFDVLKLKEDNSYLARLIEKRLGGPIATRDLRLLINLYTLNMLTGYKDRNTVVIDYPSIKEALNYPDEHKNTLAGLRTFLTNQKVRVILIDPFGKNEESNMIKRFNAQFNTLIAIGAIKVSASSKKDSRILAKAFIADILRPLTDPVIIADSENEPLYGLGRAITHILMDSSKITLRLTQPELDTLRRLIPDIRYKREDGYFVIEMDRFTYTSARYEELARFKDILLSSA